MMEYANKAIQQRDLDVYTPFENDTGQQVVSTLFDVLSSLIDAIASIVQAVFMPLTFLLIFYFLIKAFLLYKSNGAKEANEIISKDIGIVISYIKGFLIGIKNGIGSFFNWFWKKKLILGSIIAFFILIGIIRDFKIIDVLRVQSGQKAVNVMSGKILNPGIYIISPVMSDYIISHVASYQFDIAEITADSKELLDVIMQVNLSFHLDQNRLIDFYRREGAIKMWDIANSIVTPRAVEKIKNVVMNYSFKEVHEKQVIIKSECLKEIQNALKMLDISVDDLNIVNIRISKTFVDVLKEKEIMADKIDVHKKQLEQEKIQTETALEIAKRSKDQKIIESEAIAESVRRINSQVVSKEILELKKIENEKMAIEKWNGIMPSNVGGNFNLLKE